MAGQTPMKLRIVAGAVLLVAMLAEPWFFPGHPTALSFIMVACIAIWYYILRTWQRLRAAR